jgi:DNA-binding protein YbaB
MDPLAMRLELTQNDARAKADAVAGEEMGKMTQGIPLPPGFKLPI